MRLTGAVLIRAEQNEREKTLSVSPRRSAALERYLDTKSPCAALKQKHQREPEKKFLMTLSLIKKWNFNGGGRKPICQIAL